MHKTHFLLNLSMSLVLTHISFSVPSLTFALSLKAFIIGGSHISSEVPFNYVI